MTRQYSLAIMLPEQEDIKEFRLSHNKHYTPPHITLLYKTPINALEHIKTVLKEFNEFSITLTKTATSAQEHYLYLLVQPDKQLREIHKAIHTGPLKNEHNPQMPQFIPHLTLGEFDSKQALQTASKNFIQTVQVTEVAYLTHDEDGTVIDTKHIQLRKN